LLAAYFFHYQPDDMMQMINFAKNITIAGGFLVLAGAGPGALALDNWRR
jgi:putative oxidoreductase